MASKTYIVKKDGVEIEKLKTLTAAKKLADAEGAEVFSGDKCVYQGNVMGAADDTEEVKDLSEAPAKSPESGQTGNDAPAKSQAAEQTGSADATQAEQETEEKVIVTAEPVVSKKPVQPKTEEAGNEKYRLKALMNVRKKPSKESDILGTRPAGTVVNVSGIENDWLHLRDDTYILYQNGKYAEKL